MSEAGAIAFLQGIYDTLARQTDLSPDNGKVNLCLRRLVAVLQFWQSAGFGARLADRPDLAALAEGLPQLCGAAECEMEKWWCRRILASECPAVQALAAFWYLDNYKALCNEEMRLLGDARATRFVFMGSGALPLTAILLAQRDMHAEIACVDWDAEACRLASGLIRLLGLSDRIGVTQTDALGYRPHPDDTVICASLLDAPGLFEHLRASGSRRLILRDAEGPYRFCYRSARLPGHPFVERARSPLSADRINTSRYFEAVPASASPHCLSSA